MVDRTQVERLSTVASFLNRAGPLLSARQAENHLLLGLCDDLAQSTAKHISPVLLVATQAHCVVAAALRTPPRKMILTAGPAAAMQALATHAAQHELDLPGIHGPGETAACFAHHFQRITGHTTIEDGTQRVFRCRQVISPRPTPGKLRLAKPAEAPLLAEWVQAFCRECGLPNEDPRPLVERKLSRDEIYVWDDEGPVGTASIAGVGSELARVVLVYTPPERRGRGYAAACVSSLSARLLDAGLQAFLYADAANPISNHVYEKIGYQHVCNFSNWRFD